MGGKFYALQIWEVRGFFMATSCWEKNFLWLQDIVSFKYEFYYWKEASREQRVGGGGDYTSLCCVSIWGDHLSRVHSQRRDSVKPRGMQCPCYLGDRLHKQKHRDINTCMHLCAETLTCRKSWHWCTIKNTHAAALMWSVRQPSWWPEWFAFSFQSHRRLRKTLTSTPDWIYDSSIPRYLRWSKLSPCWGKTPLPYRI